MSGIQRYGSVSGPHLSYAFGTMSSFLAFSVRAERLDLRSVRRYALDLYLISGPQGGLHDLQINSKTSPRSDSGVTDHLRCFRVGPSLSTSNPRLRGLPVNASAFGGTTFSGGKGGLRFAQLRTKLEA